MNRKKNRYITEAAVIAALYTALTYVSGIFGMSYLGVQFRISEALTIMPIFTPSAILGLLAGCILGNINSPFFAADMVFGSLATLFAALLTRKLRKREIRGFPLFSFLPPIILNSLVVGAEISFLAEGGFSLELFSVSALQVAAGETAVLTVLGIPLYKAVQKLKIYQ
ncbi:MAG: Queuosine precursor transporter QueT [Firmicutes bacterium ADurb.Bin300]|nr:MAG: Queuosine precursor transporter QueT [Firmicutes bacterium ADurb.Bin300]